jgi:hypothetical protein
MDTVAASSVTRLSAMSMPDPRAYRRLATLLRDQITSVMLASGCR